ncbi:MAG TPA: hypothetical protein VFI42_14960 [Thermomicrobiaceae bacterium]|nr:hypothetical protein [Thermomicrobiaceae bacterium]
MTARHDDAELLLAREAALHVEALAVLADLKLMERLAALGRPVLVGSVALGLMTWPDIDITTLCPRLDPETTFALMRPLATHPRIGGLRFRNDTGAWNQDPSLPDGLYWGLSYRDAAGEGWKLDLWFLHETTRQPDLEHLESIPPRLTPETRLAILRIKEIWCRLPDYRHAVRSYDIYQAVLEHGVRAPEEFRAYLEARGTTE